ncbi:aromatic prenyltransferase [Nocardia sp. NPDC050697]|uniref:aromatic prenyltransferase n=1 Tax=Nocardia sp. NPDC050697 TaxID=3155158 RepID=UPI0033F7A194
MTDNSFDRNRFRDDLGDFARLAEAPYDPAIVDAVLDALGDSVRGTWPALRTTTHPVGERIVNARFTNFAAATEPAQVLRDAGLLPFTGHPLETVLAEVPAAVPVLWGVDIAVHAGVQKIWLVLPESLSIERLLQIPGLPDAVPAHAEHLRRYGDRVGIIGLDFAARTMNIYSQVLAPGTLTAAEISTLLAELDFTAATDAELALLGQTFNVYRTFSWTSPHLQRVCFPLRCTPETFPAHLDPTLPRLAAGAPYAGTGARHLNFYAAYGATSRYYKIQADYLSPAGAVLPDHKTPESLRRRA